MAWELLDEQETQPKTSLRGKPNTPARFELILENPQEAPRKKLPEDFSWYERHFSRKGQEAQGQENRDFLKSLLSGATAGFSEYFDTLKPNPESQKNIPGQFFGAVIPIGLTFKAISYPFKAIQGLTQFGRIGKGALDIAQHATTGAAYGLEKETVKAVKGEEFEPENIAVESALFAAFGGVAKAIPAARNWIKSLNTNQQSQLLVDGVIPDNLTPNQYKFYEQEVLPQLRKNAEQEYQTALQDAIKESDLKYQQDLANVRAKHEADLFEMQKNKNLSQQEFATSQSEYQNKLKQVAAEHESEIAEIQKQNQIAQQEFEQQKRDYDQMIARQNAVAESIRLKPGEEELPYRPAPSTAENPSLENGIGNVISKNEITNTTNAGKANIEAVRANDAMDYKNVNDLYKKSDQLNSKINIEPTNLVVDLIQKRNELTKISKLDPIQEQKLSFINAILKDIAEFGPEGSVIGFKPINSHVLQEQAKAIRYFMDFNFEHGNPRGILTPIVDDIENAIEFAANVSGKPEAVEAHKAAKAAYRKWASEYANDYINPYRSKENFDYSKIFRSSLDVDEFNMLNKVLNKSNAGQQLANSTRRALVEKHLGKYLENPHTANPKEFETTLKELRAVITGEEESAIREQFNQARKTPPVKQPTASKPKELPSAKIPINIPKGKQSGEITEVKIPIKKEITATPEMKIASKQMNMTPEEAMRLSDSPSGLKKLKNGVQKDVFEKIGKQKIREILYEGKIQKEFTGKELYNTINKGDNYAILSEILGESQTEDLLQAAKQIHDKRATVESIQKYAKKVGTIKAALIFGIL